jgi:Fe-S-cluster containining protein
MTDNKYDCVKCGACCVKHFNIPVLANEVNLIDERLKKYLIVSPVQPGGYSLRQVGESRKCIALEGTLGESVNCSVYEFRPPVCRRFQPGSDLCKKARLEVLNIRD